VYEFGISADFPDFPTNLEKPSNIPIQHPFSFTLTSVCSNAAMIFPIINSLEPYGYDKSDSFVREWDDFNDSQS
jgi:hypothetical protein